MHEGRSHRDKSMVRRREGSKRIAYRIESSREENNTCCCLQCLFFLKVLLPVPWHARRRGERARKRSHSIEVAQRMPRPVPPMCVIRQVRGYI